MNTIKTLKEISHSHSFDTVNPIAKKNTLYATFLTFATMIVEIIGGYYYNSMALLADGWHMSSHALALGMAYMAYVMAHKYANDTRFNFGTYKIEVLGGYTSAILLVVVAFFMFYHSVERIINPTQIAYKEAIIIAIVGLIVNLICAWLLKNDHHHHDHDHNHNPNHSHEHHHDVNLKAAYIHVLTDALTSILAITALIGGILWGASWLDPVMGIVGSVLVTIWAIGLIKQSGKILLDATMDEPIVKEIMDVINSLEDKIIIEDLHVWRVGKGKYGCILTLSSKNEINIKNIKQELSIHEELVHINVEII
ncbi:MAG: cation transporter [Sulfurimonas sp. RIFOXYD12_FULL_33_39]|uniref:CDF family Co(II)/Ni(II) efflux transporter DmeF n=1 Tax=unclassified Sulfurimonas TaxID=2623549 RepID=UPI0008C0033A|nr:MULTISPECIES: CDF family Co(II)/Ni(II) efflux transporter DmeF [unclassified Sulfurimonas]OHE05866.1 MAG: cation transporter [Sulfurimonas sp. RIFCSPLOWO2_12_FULL_34_6]OHE10219.1 MAG: cation transporter [Sulfurimonas sp. RIFOXYD12_FULL_33_39]OHE14560.1 MAG: cation transporter [Sulfurimonas sp. RIFOXYD2_FULL_34_21]DAB28324.1 MAG TPA: cation transporter [Sulfurimonas sp. UBA10385]